MEHVDPVADEVRADRRRSTAVRPLDDLQRIDVDHVRPETAAVELPQSERHRGVQHHLRHESSQLSDLVHRK